MSEELYMGIGGHLPNLVKIGGALISVCEPIPGRELEFNRWSEDDHFYSGSMMGPWVFAGRRFVATRRMAGYGAGLVGASDVGQYLTVYFHTSGHINDVRIWANAMGERLMIDGRGSVDRRHIYTAFHTHGFSTLFDEAPMRDFHALDHPYDLVVIELIDVHDASERDEVLSWLAHFPTPETPSSSAAQCLGFVPIPLPTEIAAHMGWGDADPEKRVCLLWFLHSANYEVEMKLFSYREAALHADGRSTLHSAIPFMPTVVGTNKFVDQM